MGETRTMDDDDLAAPITTAEVLRRCRQLSADAELGAALRAALADVADGEELSIYAILPPRKSLAREYNVSYTIHDLATTQYSDATIALAAALLRRSTREGAA